jgi:competence protein ComEC
MLTGAEVATVRALLCALLWLGGRALGRRTDALTALATAALLILVESPWAVYDVSFQLSFTATAALAVLAERRRGAGPPRLWRRALGLLEASVVAFVATAPLTALGFGVLQPAGIVTNLVVVPLAELVVLPLGLAGALVATVWPAAGAPIVRVAAFVAHVLDLIVHFAATHLPTFEVPPPRPVELVAIAVAFVAIALRPRRLGLWVSASLAVAIGSCATSYLPRRGVTVTFLDVGQGDAAVIETPHQTWLVDAGGRLFASPGDDDRTDPGEQAVAKFLAARRIRRLDLVVISHPHPDHYGGLAAVARHVPIGAIWTSGDDPPHLPEAPIHVARGERWSADGATLTVVSQDPDESRGQNDNSLVVRLDYAGRSVLFSGDLEAPGEEADLDGIGGHVDVVKVPHHGSRTSSSPPFVAATSPELAVISCGVANKFKFPASEVVDRWATAGARVLRTDRDGAITARIAPDGKLTVDTFLH